jgi:hypothetical protein
MTPIQAGDVSERNNAPPLFRESVVCEADLPAERRGIVRC